MFAFHCVGTSLNVRTLNSLKSKKKKVRQTPFSNGAKQEIFHKSRWEIKSLFWACEVPFLRKIHSIQHPKVK